MSLASFGSGGGTFGGFPYLKSDDIDEGMKAKIFQAPKVQSEEESGLGKEVIRVFLQLQDKMIEYTDEDGDARETDRVIWTPGIMAASALVFSLGTTEDKWVGQEGEFHMRKWETKKRSGKSWHFEPTTTTTKQQVGPKLIVHGGQNVESSSPTTQKTSPSKSTKTAGELGQKASKWHDCAEHNARFNTKEGYLAHIKEEH